MTHKVAICVCTCQRPVMLMKCLRSIAQQYVTDFEPIIIVIDNEERPNNGSAVRAFAEESPFKVYYRHQPRRSIAAARNAALEESLALKADWIAFIDDDETADPSWLAQLMAPEYLEVPVLMGANAYVYPDPLPFWAVEEGIKGEEGQRCKTAYTGNVRFSIELVKNGLFFNEGLRLMGGEDNEFFTRAHASGFEIRRTLRAVTREVAHPERLTYRAQVYRAHWCAASELRRLIITRGWLGALVRKGHTIPLNIIFGALWLLGALMVAPASREAYRDGALEGGKKLAKAAGRASALAGILPQPYRVIVGS